MKTRLLLILLLLSSYTFSQTWNQVGATQFTNFASDGAMAFDNTGVPFMVYVNPSASNKAYVKMFNGTSWVDIATPEVSTTGAANVAIKIDPTSNQPVVAYRRIDTSYMDCYKFDGTNWVAIFTNVSSGLSLSNHRLQIQINATGTVRIAGRRTDQKLTITERNTSGTGPNFVENLIHTNNTYNGDHRYDYTDFGKYYISWEDNFNSSRSGRKVIGAAANAFDYSSVNQPGATFKNISGIADENYLAIFNDVYSSSVDEVRVYNGTTAIKNVPASNDIVQLRKSNTDDKLYLMYADDTTEDLVFENYNKNNTLWSILPAIGLNSGVANFFIKMAINPIDGNMYVLYLDSGRISVEKYTIVAPLNLPRIYVDIDAAGTDDGSSWTDAHNNLSDALNNMGTNTTEIWVAAGTYKPDSSNRSKSFNMFNENLSVYGGFNGTETSISQRNIAANPAILSGDLIGDDTGVEFTSSTRVDNSYHVVKITANNVVLDGFHINDGHANGSTSNAYGAAVLISDTVNSIGFVNCEFNNNMGLTGGAVRGSFNTNANVNIENCRFRGNLSRYGSGLYLLANNNRTVNIDIVNSIFDDNRTEDQNGSNKGYTGSGAWIRANGTSSTVNLEIANCTFSKNTDIGSQVALADKGVLGLSKRTDGNSSFTANISNSIFYGNIRNSNATSVALSRGHTTLPANIFVYNSIDQASFSNLTYLSNISSLNPIFTMAVNNDFTLQSSSPAKDTGDNSKIPVGVTTDLLGAQRIFNTTVDMGAYEFGAPLSVSDNDMSTTFSIFPNPTRGVLNIDTEEQLEKIEVYNYIGQKVMDSKQLQINTSQLNSGMYLLKVYGVNGKVGLKRFIKQ